MKKFKLFMTIFTFFIAFGLMGTVNAVNGEITSNTDNHSVTISRSITALEGPATNTFTYSVTPATTNPGTITGAPTQAKIYFSAKAPTGTTATKTTTIDFAGTSFDKNGDYVFTISETGSTDNVTYPLDTTNIYTVKVAVRNASSSNFNSKIVTMYFYEGTSQTTSSKLNNNTMTFTGPAVLRTVTITNTVSGAMADSDLYFPVSVNFDSDGVYPVTGGTYDENPSSITGGTATNIYLKHGESIAIGGLVQGTTFSLSEASISPFDNYTTTILGEAGKEKTGIKVGLVDSTIAITNQYEGTALTGVFSKYLPYVIIIGAVLIIIIIAIIIRNRRLKKYEESLDL